MRELLILLAIIAAIAIIWWYLRQRRYAAAAQGQLVESRRVGQPGTGAREVSNGSATKEPGLLQDAASSAVGLPYARATDQMEEMTAEIATSRREAERAAKQLGNQATVALAAVQAAAASHGGAVPGDGTDLCPPGYPVKGAIRAKSYITPDGSTYDREVPDVCFQSVDAAVAAGFAEAIGQRGTEPEADASDDIHSDRRNMRDAPE